MIPDESQLSRQCSPKKSRHLPLSIISAESKTISIEKQAALLFSDVCTRPLYVCYSLKIPELSHISATTWQRHNAKLTLKPEHLLVQHSFERPTNPNNLSQQYQLWAEEERMVLDPWSPQDGAICHPHCHHHQEKSKRNDREKDGRKLIKLRWRVLREVKSAFKS